MPKSTINALLADKAKLKSAKTLEGSSVKIKVSGGVVHVNGAKVLKTNVYASNGVIHVINSVLVPSS